MYIARSQTKTKTDKEAEENEVKLGLNNHEMLSIGRKRYPVINQKSRLAKLKLMELLSGALQMKYVMITTWKKTSKFPKSFMKWDCMSSKRTGLMATISPINVNVYIVILDNFLIASIENWSIFQDDFASWHRGITCFFSQEKYVKSIWL